MMFNAGQPVYTSPDPTSVALTTMAGAVGNGTGCLVGDKLSARTVHIQDGGAVRVLTDGTWPAPLATIPTPGVIHRGCFI